MSTNPFKGIGAIKPNPKHAATNAPKMASLGKQYQDNLNEVWPNSNQSLVLGTAHAGAPFFTQYTLDKGGVINDRMANNDTFLTNSGNDIKYSPNTNYVAFGHNTTPFVSIYKRDGLTFTKLSNPASLPPAACQGVDWSPDNTYLALAHGTSPFVTIYKRSGDTFTKLSDPATLPTGTGSAVSFSKDGTYLAVAHSITPFVTIYKRDGDTFTKLSDPATLPASSGTDVDWSPDNTYLALSHTSSPRVTIYKRSGDTFTKLANPSTLPSTTGNGYAVKFSPNGNVLAVGTNISPYVAIYYVNSSTDTFTWQDLVDGLATIPTGQTNSLCYTKDSKILYIGHITSPFFTAIGLTYVQFGPSFTSYFYNDLKQPPSTVNGIDILYTS